jgi:hypothetical protein
MKKLMMGVAVYFMAAAAVADVPASQPRPTSRPPPHCDPVCITLPLSTKVVCFERPMCASFSDQ